MKITNYKKVFLSLIMLSIPALESGYAQNKNDKDIYETTIDELINIPLSRANVIGLPHPHPKGEWHIQYQYMDMQMRGTMTGDKKNNSTKVLQNFAMAPTKMYMRVHMGMIMYGLTNKWTLMAMANFHNFDMDMIMMNGSEMKMESNGLSDTKVKLTYIVYHKNRTSLIASIGSSLPTGSIDKTSINMTTGKHEMMPYNMQLGSGTVDPFIDIGFLVSTMKYSWGIAATSTFRVYDNKNDYRLGNQYKITSGYSYNVNRWFGISSRFDMNFRDNINGSDLDINPMISPNHRPDLRAGSRYELSVGFLFKVSKKIEFLVDYRRPIYQNLDGPQMFVKSHILLSLQFFLNKKGI